MSRSRHSVARDARMLHICCVLVRDFVTQVRTKPGCRFVITEVVVLVKSFRPVNMCISLTVSKHTPTVSLVQHNFPCRKDSKKAWYSENVRHI